MANATASRDDKQSAGDVVSYALSNVKVFAGTMAAINTAGHAVKAAATASFVFAGFAADTVDNSTGTAGAARLDCYTEGTFEIGIAAAAQADVGKDVYVVDDSTVKLFDGGAGAVNIRVGRIVEVVNATTVRVKI